MLLLSGFSIAQTRSLVGQFSVSITLNGVATVPAGTCVSQTLFNQIGAVVRVTCVDNPFVSIAPSLDMQLPGTFGSTFRYPMFSSANSFNFATANTNTFNSPASTVTDMSIYRTAPQAITDSQGLMDMVISF